MRKRLSILLAAAVAGLAIGPVSVQAAPIRSASTAGTTASWYPQFLYGGHNRINPKETILTPQNVSQLTSLWTYSTGASNPFAAPVVDHGMVFEGLYACCPSPSSVIALDAATGRLIWTFPTAAPVTSPSAVAHGVVLAGDGNGSLYAIDARTGTLLWSGDAGQEFFDPENLTVTDSTVYAVTDVPGQRSNSQLSAWSVTGCGAATCAPLWTATIKGSAMGPAADGNTVFVASGKGRLYAFSASGCSTPPCAPLWRGLFSADGGTNEFGALAIAHGIVYVANGSARGVDAFPTAGCGTALCIPVWAYEASHVNPAGLAIVGTTLYVGDESALEAFSAQCGIGQVCEPTWRDAGAPEAHLLVANGVVYADSGTTLLADDASTGVRLWQQSLPSAPQQGPATANGVVYVATTLGNQVLAYSLDVRANRG